MSKEYKQRKRDPHYIRAKKEGFRARSAFKLFDIQNKFNIFFRAFYILDIGCSPGSWLQVIKKFAEENLKKYNAQKYYRDHYKIMGVDLIKITSIDNINAIKMDLFNPEFQNKINEYFNGNKLDLIVSDASINKSGNKFSDQARQIKLCDKVLDTIKNNLKGNGNCVIKCFQGEDFNDFFKKMKNEFNLVKTYKPKASRKISNEIYVIGLNRNIQK